MCVVNVRVGKENVFFVGCAISRCLSTTPHPMNRARGSILLVHHFMIILMPAIFVLMTIVRYDHNVCFEMSKRFEQECGLAQH